MNIWSGISKEERESDFWKELSDEEGIDLSSLEDEHRCPICNKNFPSEFALGRHLERAHSIL